MQAGARFLSCCLLYAHHTSDLTKQLAGTAGNMPQALQHPYQRTLRRMSASI